MEEDKKIDTTVSTEKDSTVETKENDTEKRLSSIEQAILVLTDLVTQNTTKEIKVSEYE